MANYVKSNLTSGEEILFQTKYHAITYLSLESLLTLGLYPYLKRNFDEFAVTSKRVIIKTGVLSKTTYELNINKVERIDVYQSLLGRILGYGSISVNGTGGKSQVYKYIINPNKFKSEIIANM